MQEQATLPVGTIVHGRYIVQKLLGKNDIGAVYVVADQFAAARTASRFALKEVLHLSKSGRDRFLAEAKVLKKLDHSALPRIYNVFREDKYARAFLLSEYIEGLNLELLRLQQRESVFSLSQVISLMAPIVEAIAYLHRQEPPIIHQNIKPSNIVVSSANRKAVLVNFGVFRRTLPDSLMAAIRLHPLGYAAPEQYSGEITTQTDIYGLGATFYTLLTDATPPDALFRMAHLGSDSDVDPLDPVNRVAPNPNRPTSASQTISRSVALHRMLLSGGEEEVVTSRSANRPLPPISSAVAEVLHRAVSLKRNARFATVEEFCEALRQASHTASGEPQSVAASGSMAVPKEEDTELSAKVATEQTPTPDVDLVAQQSLGTALADAREQLEASIPIELSQPLPTTPVPDTEVSASKPPPKNFRVLVPILLTLLMGIIVGTSLWSDEVYHGSGSAASTSALPKVTPHPSPTSTVVPTPSSTSPTNIAALYNGTIYDIATNVTTKMSLTGIQQTPITIGGNFTGLHRTGTFNGIIDPHPPKHIQFTVKDSAGHLILSFDGHMQSDGELSGSYCSVDQYVQCTGDYGLWSVAPAS